MKKVSRKCCSLLLCVGLLVPTAAMAGAYSDVADDAWYAEAVQYVADEGLMTGTDDGTFSPQQTVSRGMMVSVLYRLAGEPIMPGDTNWGEPFKDVADDAYYHDAVYWARGNGVANGISDDLFAPDAAVSREQVAALLFNYSQYCGELTDDRGKLTGYVDIGKLSPWAREAVEWAVAEGWLSGDSEGYLRPDAATTRAELAAILMRFDNRTLESEARAIDTLPGTYPKSMTTTRGTGGTGFVLQADGTFTGAYRDPSANGTDADEGVYCEFSGRFGDFMRQPDGSIRMRLIEFTPNNHGDFESGGIHYTPVDRPMGFDVMTGGEVLDYDFVFYLPGTPVDVFSEDFLNDYNYSILGDTFGFYALINVADDHGFYGMSVGDAK